MQLSERDKYIIERYQEDEKMMILLFAQWCVNNDLDAHELYERAYPQQGKNKALEEALDQTVAKDQAEDISREIVLTILQAFGNDDLAFEVSRMNEKR